MNAAAGCTVGSGVNLLRLYLYIESKSIIFLTGVGWLEWGRVGVYLYIKFQLVLVNGDIGMGRNNLMNNDVYFMLNIDDMLNQIIDG